MAHAKNSRLFTLFAVPVTAMGLMLAGGCKNSDDLSALDLNKGLFDAKQIGRWEKDPITNNILENLDVGAEETETEFASARDVRQEDLVSVSSDYLIGENDVVQISITDLNGPGQETLKIVRVSATGRVSLPLLPQPIPAKGLTEQGLEDSIKKAYRDAQIIQDAKVSVAVTEPRGRVYSVLGNVGGPGQYGLYDADFRLLDALVAARDVGGGGQGVDYIYVVRKKQSSTGSSAPANGAPVTPPTVKPGTDPLGAARPARPIQAMLLQEPGKASADRVIVIDGKEVVIKGTDTGTGTTPAPTTPAPTTPDATPPPRRHPPPQRQRRQRQRRQRPRQQRPRKSPLPPRRAMANRWFPPRPPLKQPARPAPPHLKALARCRNPRIVKSSEFPTIRFVLVNSNTTSRLSRATSSSSPSRSRVSITWTGTSSAQVPIV